MWISMTPGMPAFILEDDRQRQRMTNKPHPERLKARIMMAVSGLGTAIDHAEELDADPDAISEIKSARESLKHAINLLDDEA